MSDLYLSYFMRNLFPSTWIIDFQKLSTYACKAGANPLIKQPMIDPFLISASFLTPSTNNLFQVTPTQVMPNSSYASFQKDRFVPLAVIEKFKSIRVPFAFYRLSKSVSSPDSGKKPAGICQAPPKLWAPGAHLGGSVLRRRGGTATSSISLVGT